MPKLRVHNFTISLDGYGAGPDQSAETPLGVGGEQLHDWVVPTRAFRKAHGQEGGEEGSIDEVFATRQFENVGAMDHGPKHVRAGARAVAGSVVEGLVG